MGLFALSEMESLVRAQLNAPTEGILSSAEIRKALNDGYKDVSRLAGCIENYDVVSTVSGDRFIPYDAHRVNFVFFGTAEILRVGALSGGGGGGEPGGGGNANEGGWVGGGDDSAGEEIVLVTPGAETGEFGFSLPSVGALSWHKGPLPQYSVEEPPVGEGSEGIFWESITPPFKTGKGGAAHFHDIPIPVGSQITNAYLRGVVYANSIASYVLWPTMPIFLKGAVYNGAVLPVSMVEWDLIYTANFVGYVAFAFVPTIEWYYQTDGEFHYYTALYPTQVYYTITITSILQAIIDSPSYLLNSDILISCENPYLTTEHQVWGGAGMSNLELAGTYSTS